MTGQFLDTDDRKEAFMLLARMERADRIEFLNWCCKQAKVLGAYVTHTSGEPRDVWGDMMSLVVTHGVDPRVMFEELGRRAK